MAVTAMNDQRPDCAAHNGWDADPVAVAVANRVAMEALSALAMRQREGAQIRFESGA